MGANYNRKQDVEHTIVSLGDVCVPLEKILEILNKAKEDGNVSVSFDGLYRDLRFYKITEETDEEYNRRIAREEKMYAEFEKRKEKDERDALKRLKAKYESN